MTVETRNPARRRRAAALLLATGAVLTASGTWAAWQSTGDLDQAVNTATVTVDVTDGGAGAGTWNTAIADLLPGDFFYRWMDVENTGTVPQTFAGALSGTGTLPGALTAWVSSCDEAFSGGSFTTCGGVDEDLLGTTGAPAAFGNLSSLGVIAPGDTLHLLMRVTFDENADQVTYEDQASTLTLAVTGTATGLGDRTNG